MASQQLIMVEVAYATPEKQVILSVTVARGSRLESVIRQSGIFDLFPEIDLAKQKIGIFSQVKQLTDIVSEGDRIEIYRPLVMDPMEARRKRAGAR